MTLQAELAESRKRRCVVNTGTDGGRRGTATPEIRGEYLAFFVVGVIHGSSRRARKTAVL